MAVAMGYGIYRQPRAPIMLVLYRRRVKCDISFPTSRSIGRLLICWPHGCGKTICVDILCNRNSRNCAMGGGCTSSSHPLPALLCSACKRGPLGTFCNTRERHVVRTCSFLLRPWIGVAQTRMCGKCRCEKKCWAESGSIMC